MGMLDKKVDARVTERLVEDLTKETVLKEHAITELEKAAPKAAKVIISVMNTKPSGDKTILAERRLQFEAAQDILSRTLSKPKEVIETITREYTPAEIDSAHKTMGEIVKMALTLDKKGVDFLLPRDGEALPSKPPNDADDADDASELEDSSMISPDDADLIVQSSEKPQDIDASDIEGV